ncbi:MAG: hypothetical protein A2201_08665 [Alicyclobacillus sp. RIFOXYA1_FULL_53_8]|nr:MAG: hypothetical protein A2201_08665 [Alicyclobacillus sp. RIFOXYA1_FULL_53_8]
MAYEFRLPDIGEGLHEAEVLQWFVKVGDTITADQPVVEVQTDKAAVEITSPVAGRVVELAGDVGSVVKVGDVLIAVDTAGAGSVAGAVPENSQPARPSEAVPQPALTQSTQQPPPMLSADAAPGGPVPALASNGQGKRVLAAPAVRKLARDLGVDLTQVVASDPRGHITKADVERQAAAKLVTQPVASAEQSAHDTGGTNSSAVIGGAKLSAPQAEEVEERHPIRGLRKRIYENMARSMYTAPQATGMDDLDVSRLVEVRNRLLPFAQAQSIKLTYLPFIIKAVTYVLQEQPLFNASVDDEKMELVYKKHIHIGIATATPEGLLVPVIRHANHKSVFQIASELEDLTRRARDRKLTLTELSGSTFTISSTGATGGWYATPILNYPEVAILGVHSIAKKPVVLEDDSIVVRQMMGFSLSFDHRVIDGEPVGAFMHRFKQLLENPELMMVL